MTNDIAKPKDSRNIWKIIFAISLALNIAVLGALGGIALRFSKSPLAGEGHLKERRTGSIYIRALSRDQRRELGRRLRDQEEGSKDSRTNIEAGFKEVIRILRSEDFDKEAFEAVAKDHSNKSHHRLENAQGLLLSYIISMSFEQRSAYADRIEKALNRNTKIKR